MINKYEKIETAIKAMRAAHDKGREALRSNLERLEGRKVHDWELDMIFDFTEIEFRKWAQTLDQ